MRRATYTLMPGLISPIPWTCESCLYGTQRKFMQCSAVRRSVLLCTRRLCLMTLLRFKAATTSPYPDTPWEVFSFELIPLNAHYTMLQADFLNGHRSNPAPPPPTYDGNDEKSYSFDISTAWGQRNVKRWNDWEESFTSERSTQGSFERLRDLDATAEYGRMLEDARCKRNQAFKRQPNGKAIYHVYPLGVSLIPGNFTVEWGSQNYINGGSNLNYFDSLTRNAPMRTFRVNVRRPLLPYPPSIPLWLLFIFCPAQTVPLVHWIISSFRPADYGSSPPLLSFALHSLLASSTDCFVTLSQCS